MPSPKLKQYRCVAGAAHLWPDATVGVRARCQRCGALRCAGQLAAHAGVQCAYAARPGSRCCPYHSQQEAPRK